VLAVEGEEPVIADRHTRGVAPEVAQDGGCATEGRLGVDDPVGLEERVDEGSPRRRGAQRLAAARQVELALRVAQGRAVDPNGVALMAEAAEERIHPPAPCCRGRTAIRGVHVRRDDRRMAAVASSISLKKMLVCSGGRRQVASSPLKIVLRWPQRARVLTLIDYSRIIIRL